MTYTPDELQRAVEGLDTALRSKASHVELRDFTSDLRLLLSERAELLATVDRMRGALEPFALAADNMDGDEPDSLFIYDSPESTMIDYADLRRARAALTTGEATNAGERA